jgi:hypothetical protein
MRAVDNISARLERASRARIILQAALLCSVTLTGCGGTTPADVSGGDAGVEICDGRAAVRLYAASLGGGPVPSGVNMLSENGWHYLLVSGKCEAWVLKELDAPLRHVSLSREQAKALERDFRLGEWKSFSQAGGGCPDASGVRFRFDKDEVVGVPCGLKADHPLVAMSSALVLQIEQLYRGGTAVDGDVRYLLAIEAADDPSTNNAYRNAPPWPLSFLPSTVAVPLTGLAIYQRGGSRHAGNDEASLLRGLRSSWLEGVIGSRTSQFIPVEQADGARFRLYLRDSSPWEDASGLLPDDLTSH